MTSEVFFAARAQATTQKVRAWSDEFVRQLGEDGQGALAEGCVYAVGSAGRGELGDSSDLDVFVVTNGKPSRLDEILVQAALIKTMRRCGLPDPSNEATFLRLHAAQELEERLGDIEDDSPLNTFTARMLLLLESRPFYGEEAYQQLLRRVVAAYWRNEELHPNDYLPMLLVNDIVRYWRVVLLNYEAKHSRKEREARRTGEGAERVRGARRLASYKLRFARCMTCYSMILALLWKSRRRPGGKPHVGQRTMLELIGLTPVQRLQHVRAEASGEGVENVTALATELLALYQGYLETRAMPDEQLKAQLDVKRAGGSLFMHADRFGEKMSALVQALGEGSPLIRYVVV